MAYPYQQGAYGAPYGAYPPRPAYPVQGAYGAPYGAVAGGYGAPPYGAAVPGYGAGYGAPAYGAAVPGYGGYGAYGAGGVIVPPPIHPYKFAGAPYRAVPQFYNRPQLSWMSPYQDPRQPFALPYGIEPHLAAKLMEASYVFRLFDSNCNGVLSKKEFKRAMWHLGYFMAPQDASRLFYMLDVNRSGQIDEREFAAFWLSTHY